MVENRTLRHVVSPDAMDPRRFPWDSIRADTAASVHANLTTARSGRRPNPFATLAAPIGRTRFVGDSAVGEVQPGTLEDLVDVGQGGVPGALANARG